MSFLQNQHVQFHSHTSELPSQEDLTLTVRRVLRSHELQISQRITDGLMKSAESVMNAISNPGTLQPAITKEVLNIIRNKMQSVIAFSCFAEGDYSSLFQMDQNIYNPTAGSLGLQRLLMQMVTGKDAKSLNEQSLLESMRNLQNEVEQLKKINQHLKEQIQFAAHGRPQLRSPSVMFNNPVEGGELQLNLKSKSSSREKRHEPLSANRKPSDVHSRHTSNFEQISGQQNTLVHKESENRITVKSLEEQLKKIKEENQLLEKQAKFMAEEVQSLKQMLEQLSPGAMAKRKQSIEQPEALLTSEDLKHMKQRVSRKIDLQNLQRQQSSESPTKIASIKHVIEQSEESTVSLEDYNKIKEELDKTTKDLLYKNELVEFLTKEVKSCHVIEVRLSQKIENYNQRMVSLKTNIKDLNREVQTKHAQWNQLEEINKSMSLNIQNLEKRLRDMHEENEELRRRVDELEDKEDEFNQQHQKDRDQGLRQAELFQARNDELSSRVMELEQNLGRNEDRNRQVIAALSVFMDKKQTVAERINAILKALVLLDATAEDRALLVGKKAEEGISEDELRTELSKVLNMK